jgi:biotin carboxyl carrier protein
MFQITTANRIFQLTFDEQSLLEGKLNEMPFSLSDFDTHSNTVFYQGKKHAFEFIAVDEANKTVILRINGVKYDVKVEESIDILLNKMGIKRGSDLKMNELKAPMPGMVLKVLVSEGMEVKKGDALLILEAMKMENNIKAIGDAKVKSIICKAGKAVEKNQLLIIFE